MKKVTVCAMIAAMTVASAAAIPVQAAENQVYITTEAVQIATEKDTMFLPEEKSVILRISRAD